MSGLSSSNLLWGIADLAGKTYAISGLCAFDRSHGFSSGRECLQVLWGNEQQSGTKSVAGLARLFGSVRHSNASPGKPGFTCTTVMQHSLLAALMVRVNVYNDASIAKSLAIEWQLQAIWATCSKHHTMVPAYTASVVAVTYLVMVSADTS